MHIMLFSIHYQGTAIRIERTAHMQTKMTCLYALRGLPAYKPAVYLHRPALKLIKSQIVEKVWIQNAVEKHVLHMQTQIQ